MLVRLTNILRWSPALVVLLACACRSSNDQSAREAIAAQDKVFEQGVNGMNVNMVMSVYWGSPDLVAYYPGGNLQGYDNVKQWWWDFFNKGDIRKFEVTASHCEVAGDMAYEWGTFTMIFQPKNGAGAGGPGRYLEVWKYIGKSWVIVADHASFISPELNTEKNTK